MIRNFQRQPFGMLSEPRVATWARLMRMLEQFQTGLIESFAPLYVMPFVQGRQITVGPLAASGTFTVKHGLQRMPIGWLVLDVVRASGGTGALAVYRRSGDTRNATDITFYGSASFESLTLWVW